MVKRMAIVRGVDIEQEFPPVQVFPSFGKLISVILANTHILALISLLVLLIFGGLWVIIGAGSNDPQKTERGKKAVTAAIIGFLIIFASYWIIQIIETITGIDIFRSNL